MKGIIFVVWEKYLGERFGAKFVKEYRGALGESESDLPLAGRTYPDAMLLQGLKTASTMTFLTEDRLMVEYGRYFMLNGLVEYLCGYLLAQAWSGYDLLLLMRDAHAQMRRTPDGLTPPLFEYEVLSDDHNHMILTYDSGRHLCSLLEGCIYGAAEQGLSNLVLQALPSTINESLELRDIKRVVDQNQGPYFPEIYKEQRQLKGYSKNKSSHPQEGSR